MVTGYSGDEMFALVISSVIAIVSWGNWFYQLATVRRHPRHEAVRWPLALAPAGCAALLLVVLRNWSAEDVRTAPAYIVFYLAVGAAWIGLFRMQMPLFGVSFRDDVLERGNASASTTLIGALLGSTSCFAGANVGNGPGWWVVLFSGCLSTGCLLLLWWVVDYASGLADKVTIDRDPEAGLRTAGFFAGTGLILGKAVAGDWISVPATVADFGARFWPALALSAGVVLVERRAPSALGCTRLARALWGWLPAVLYLLAGAFVAFGIHL